MQLISKLLNILAIFLLLLPSLIALSQPKLMQACDFVMDFYTVGAMIQSGQGVGIYPPAGAESFFGAPFDNFCKHLLPYLPKESVAIYMYSPLLALLFAPFSLLPAPAAMVIYQVICILMLIGVGLLLRGRDYKKVAAFVFMSALFCPVFHTLLIGQLGILYGLGPLALAYFCLIKNKHLLAGLSFSLLALKPQFLPTALLVCAALLFCRKPKATIGLVLGMVAFAAVNIATCGQNLFIAWFHNFKMADAIYAKEIYHFGEYLVVCLPAVLLQFFPYALRESVKLPIYSLSAAIGVFSLWRAVRLLRVAIAQDEREKETKLSPESSHTLHFNQAIGLVLIMGLIVLTLVVPHFLFYDLCALVLIVAIGFSEIYPLELAMPMRLMRMGMWWVSNIYYLLFMFAPIGPLKQWFALILVSIYSYFYCSINKQMSNLRNKIILLK